MRRLIDLMISILVFGFVAGTLGSRGIGFGDWELWAVHITIFTYGIYNYMDGRLGWSQGPHNHTP